MAMDPMQVSLQTNTTSLFRPVPISTLQNNLAEYYQRTADFVGERFHDMISTGDQSRSPSQEKKMKSEGTQHRINPIGLGMRVDILV